MAAGILQTLSSSLSCMCASRLFSYLITAKSTSMLGSRVGSRLVLLFPGHKNIRRCLSLTAATSLDRAPSRRVDPEVEQDILDSVLGRRGQSLVSSKAAARASRAKSVESHSVSTPGFLETTVTYPDYVAHCHKEVQCVRACSDL